MSKDWAVDIQEFEAAVSKNTKMLVINTPNNPFGKVWLLYTINLLNIVCSIVRLHNQLMSLLCCLLAAKLYSHTSCSH